jgi:TfoX/Sxy family transcriptional regulator of competence genes
MAFNELIAERVRNVLAEEHPITEKRMFGGLAFMVDGHMCCGIVGEELVVRVGAEAHQESLSLPHARTMDFTGRPMKGFVYVGPAGYNTKPALRKWIRRGLRFVRQLPPK